MADIPVSPTRQQLPFHGSGFDWPDFEHFFLDFLGSGLSLPVAANDPDGEPRVLRHRILSPQLVGRRGGTQPGIDLLAETDQGETWAFECKHRKSWTAEQTRKAIKKAETRFQAGRYFLLVTCPDLPSDVLSILDEHPRWEIWSGITITARFLHETPKQKRVEILARNFGPEWAKEFFPLQDQALVSADEFFRSIDRPERLFHHRAELEGRTVELSALDKFVRDRTSRVLVFTSPGGHGKTRLLKSFSNDFAQRHPNRTLYFTNPAAGDPEPHGFRGVEATGAVVAHDDAHRVEAMPTPVIRELIADGAKTSKLILAARPQAVEPLRAKLINLGYAAEEITTHQLKPLTRAEMKRLAESLLSTKNQRFADALTTASGGCALIAVAGAGAIEKGLIQREPLDSEAFRHEVFSRFEGDELSRLGEDAMPAKQLSRLLRWFAVLSPWRQNQDSSSELASLLGLRAVEVEQARDAFLAGGLLVENSEGLRVTPDLLSDHLVYRACYDDNGKPRRETQQLLANLKIEATAAALRNLAEAEWRANAGGARTVSLLEPVWKAVLRQFEQATFWNRVLIVEHWATFSIFQPERAIALAREAIRLDSPGSAENGFAWLSDCDTHARVLAKIPALLKPVAIGHEAFRDEALDLIWSLESNPALESGPPESAPLRTIAEVANIEANFPAAPNGVLNWLERTLTDPKNNRRLAGEPNSSELATILTPMFIKFVRRDVWEGNKVSLGTAPVLPKAVRPLWERSLKILREHVLPNGDVGALVALSVLDRAIDRVCPPYGGKIPPGVLRSWLPLRRMALNMIEEIQSACPCELIQLKVAQTVKNSAGYDESKAFSRDCRQVLHGMPDTVETRRARVLLSNDYEDMEWKEIARLREEADDWHKERHRRWEQLTSGVAEEFLASVESSDEAIASLTELIERYRTMGFWPNLGPILAAITQADPPLASGMLKQLLAAHEETSIDPWISSLIKPGAIFPDQELEEQVVLCLRSSRTELRRSILNFLAWRDAGEFPDVVGAAMLKLAESGDAEARIGLTQFLDFALPKLPPLVNVLVKNCESEAELNALLSAVNPEYRQPGEIPAGFIGGTLLKIEPEPHLEDNRIRFLNWAAKSEPRAVFDFFVRRIARGPGENFTAVPFLTRIGLCGLASDPEFEALAARILEKIREGSGVIRDEWSRFFRFAVFWVNEDLAIRLLHEWLEEIDDARDLVDLAEILGYDGSTVVFRHPELVRQILLKGRELGVEAHDKVQWTLIAKAGPDGRSYTGGELDSEHHYLLNEAEKAVSRHAADPVLRKFFERIVSIEKADRTRARDWANEEQTDW